MGRAIPSSVTLRITSLSQFFPVPLSRLTKRWEGTVTVPFLLWLWDPVHVIFTPTSEMCVLVLASDFMRPCGHGHMALV